MKEFIKDTVGGLSGFFGAVALAIIIIGGIFVLPVWIVVQIINHWK